MAAMVLRDRNHPSVVMWSIGNEIPMRFTKHGTNLSAVLRDFVHDADIPGSGRPVTSAHVTHSSVDFARLHTRLVLQSISLFCFRS
jgi:beta-galactosidase